MPYNGSGLFSPATPAYPAIAGTLILASQFNSVVSDIATGLSTALTKDGQTVPTANLAMGGFRHTGVSNGVARDQYATVGQVQDSTLPTLGSVSGADTITASGSPAITAYTNGQVFKLTPASQNTGAVTLNVNGLGTQSFIHPNGAAMRAGDLIPGQSLFIEKAAAGFLLIDPRPTPVFDGYLTTTSATVLTLGHTHFGGNRLFVMDGSGVGANVTIPLAGVTLSNSGTAANTIYYAYAYLSAGLLALEHSTTVPTLDAATGWYVKGADRTRTLVGTFRTNASSQFQNTSDAKLVFSYLNMKPIHMGFAAGAGTTAVPISTITQVASASAICPFPSFAALFASVQFQNPNVTGVTINTDLKVNGSHVNRRYTTIPGSALMDCSVRREVSVSGYFTVTVEVNSSVDNFEVFSDGIIIPSQITGIIEVGSF